MTKSNNSGPMDLFETKLSQQPLKGPPPAFRDQLLAEAARSALDAYRPNNATTVARAANSTAATARCIGVQHPSAVRVAWDRCVEALVWRQPYAWGSLGVIWLIAISLQVQSQPPHNGRSWTSATSGVLPETDRSILAEQARLRAELFGPAARTERSPASPRRQSEGSPQTQAAAVWVIC